MSLKLPKLNPVNLTPQEIDLVDQYVRRMVGKFNLVDEVDDVVQEALLNLLKSNLGQNHTEGERKSYITICTINSMYKYVYHKKRRPLLMSNIHNPERVELTLALKYRYTNTIHIECRTKIQDFVRKVELEYQNKLQDRYIKELLYRAAGFTQEEAGIKFKLKPSSVYRKNKTLRKLLTEVEPFDTIRL